MLHHQQQQDYDDRFGNQQHTIGSDGGNVIKEQLQHTNDPISTIQQLQETLRVDPRLFENVETNDEQNRFLSIFEFTDLLGVRRNDLYKSMMIHLREQMLKRLSEQQDQASSLQSHENLAQLLDQVFPFVQYEELRPIIFQILLNFGGNIPDRFIERLKTDPIFEHLPTPVKIQVWERDSAKFFEFLDKSFSQYRSSYFEKISEHVFKTPILFDATSNITNLDLFTTGFRRSSKLLNFLVGEVLHNSPSTLYPMFQQYCRTKYLAKTQQTSIAYSHIKSEHPRPFEKKKPKHHKSLAFLGSLRNDVLMTAHDRKFTEISTMDTRVHYFCWWMDAWLRTVSTQLLTFFSDNSTYDINRKKSSLLQKSATEKIDPGAPAPQSTIITLPSDKIQAAKYDDWNICDMVDVRRMNELIGHLSQMRNAKKPDANTSTASVSAPVDSTDSVFTNLWLDLQLIMYSHLHSNAVVFQLYHLLELTESVSNSPSLLTLLSSVPLFDRKKHEPTYAAKGTVVQNLKGGVKSAKIKISMIGGDSKHLVPSPSHFLNENDCSLLNNCMTFLTRLHVLQYEQSSSEGMKFAKSSTTGQKAEPTTPSTSTEKDQATGLPVSDLFVDNEVFPFVQSLISSKVTEHDAEIWHSNRKSIEDRLKKALVGSSPSVILHRKLVSLLLYRTLQNIRILKGSSALEEDLKHTNILEDELAAQAKKFYYLAQLLLLDSSSSELKISSLGRYLISHDNAVLHTLIAECERLVVHCQQCHEIQDKDKLFATSANCILTCLNLICEKIVITYLKEEQARPSSKRSVQKFNDSVLHHLAQVMRKFASVSHELALSGHMVEQEIIQKQTQQEKANTQQEKQKSSAWTKVSLALREKTQNILQFFFQNSHLSRDAIKECVTQTQEILHAPIEIKEKKKDKVEARKQQVAVMHNPNAVQYQAPPNGYGRGGFYGRPQYYTPYQPYRGGYGGYRGRGYGGYRGRGRGGGYYSGRGGYYSPNRSYNNTSPSHYQQSQSPGGPQAHSHYSPGGYGHFSPQQSPGGYQHSPGAPPQGYPPRQYTQSPVGYDPQHPQPLPQPQQTSHLLPHPQNQQPPSSEQTLTTDSAMDESL